MSHVEQGPSEREDIFDNRWFVPADEAGHPSLPFNVLTGIVTSRTEGLTRNTLRIRVGERTDLRVRWSSFYSAYNAIGVGQAVRIAIPESAVQLEAGGFRRGKQRWNRWIGRVVLVNRTNDDPAITVKLHRDSITLRSVGLVIGAHASLAAWDTVNIVVDPQQVRLAPIRRPCSQMMSALSSCSRVDSQPSSVWLRATIQSVRSIQAGLLVALNVGGVNLFALIEAGPTAVPPWTVGASVEININGCDAWVRRFTDSPILPCSIVLSSEIGVRQLSVPIQATDIQTIATETARK